MREPTAKEWAETDEAIESPPAAYVRPPLELFPSQLQDFIHAAAESLNVDVGFILLPLLSATGSAIGNSRSIFLKRNFSQPPVIWSVIVGRSGRRKSPALERACFAVVNHERDLTCQNQIESERYREELAEWESKAKKNRGAKPQGPASLTALMDDMTLEALADAIHSNPHGILVKKDELSHWFAAFDQYRSGKGADVSRWLSLHTGVMYAVDRRTDRRHYRISQPRISITGGIQPKVLRRVLTEDFFDRGLPARFLFAAPPMRQDKWNEAVISQRLEAKVSRLFDELWLLQPDLDDHKRQCPRLLRLDADAKSEYVAFYNECGATTFEVAENEEATWYKLTGYAARLALVGQLLHDPHAEIVTGEVMRVACDLARWSGAEAARIYATFVETAEQSDRRRLIDFIASRGGNVTVREVTQSFRPLKNQRDKAEAALRGLVSARLGNWEPIVHDGGRGRPTRKFQLLQVSTSTKIGGTRGQLGNYVDVDTPKTQKNAGDR
jgi:hypothetical protein